MIRTLRSTMLLEFSRDDMEQLDNDEIYCHPYVRCSCGSDKVFNYGIPKNNGKYFFCRTCQASLKVQD
jgi:predicted SprT family Zn-dependent metalloprotease